MRFLVDASAGFRLAEWLRSNDHEVLFSPDLGTDPGDDALLRLAHAENWVVITLDRNFGKSIFTDGAPAVGIVTLPWVAFERRVQLLALAIERHSDDLMAGCLVVADADRFRLRVPPDRSQPRKPEAE
mgnify:CR=1 FL=1